MGNKIHHAGEQDCDESACRSHLLGASFDGRTLRPTIFLAKEEIGQDSFDRT